MTISVMVTTSSSTTSSEEPKSIQVHLNSLTSTVRDLKQHLANATGYAIEDQRVIFQGQVLKDLDAKVTQFNIKNGQTVHLVPKPGATTSSAPSSTSDPFNAALSSMKQTCTSEAQFMTAVKTLIKVIENIEEHPSEEKYRKINMSNPVFAKRITSVAGAPECMRAMGFKETSLAAGGDSYYVLVPSAEAWENLLKCKLALQALTPQQQQQPNLTGAGNLFENAGGMFGGRGGLNPSAMMNDPRVQETLRNPAMMQALLNHPMAQNLFGNSPAMQMLQRDPQLLSSLLPMMSNQQTATPGTPGVPAQQQQNQGGDAQMTEEEMIAEAIRRSLQ